MATGEREPDSEQPQLIGQRGIRKRRRTYQVNTRIRGHVLTRGGFSTRAQAERWLWEMKTDPVALEEHMIRQAAGRAPTVSWVVERYMKAHGGHVRTADRHRQYQAHVDRLLGGCAAERIRQPDVDGYARERQHEGAGAKTAYNELCFLRSALNYGLRSDWLVGAPRFRLHKPRCERARVARPAEVRQLLIAAPLVLQRVVLAAWATGMRRGEIIGAQWSWVRSRDQVLTIPGGAAKTGRAREVWLPPRLWALLQDDPRHPEHVWCREAIDSHGQRRGKPRQWSPSALRREWATASAAASNTADVVESSLQGCLAGDLMLGKSLQIAGYRTGWAKRRLEFLTPELQV